jgi:nitrous oxide reductase
MATLCALAFLLLAGGLVLASCGGDDEAEATETVTLPTTETTDTETTAETTTAEEEKPVVVRVTVLGGAPQGGIVRETVRKGDRVVLQVRSDQADEVHVHGYDVSGPVAPGEPARITFVADVPGRFEVELEESGVPIADLTVRP